MTRAESVLLRPLTVLALLLPLLVATPTRAQAPTGEDDVVALTTLGNRADLLSGGDALIQVDLPAGADAASVSYDVDGRDVSDAFAVRSDGRVLGLVTGLEEGVQRLTATLPDGSGAHLDLTNHPRSGPIFSGPQVEPWTCPEESTDDRCTAPVTYEFLYMSTDGGGLQSYDPDNPPEDVAMTTTDEGMEVPFIVRIERGVIVRDRYAIAMLYNPEEEWTPTEPQPQWNNKLLITHGASCDITFSAGSAPSVTSDGVAGDSPTVALGRGFAVMSHALDNAGHNCDNVTQAESLIATKELLVDTYGGPIRYTIGTGCSGGSLALQHIANSYPGVYQGILPQCSFTDSWSSTMQYQDYVLTLRYFGDPSLWAPGVVWTPLQIENVNGHPNITNPITFTSVIAPTRDPSRECPGLDQELVYHHVDNVEGVRCAIMDYMVNSVGRRAQDAWTANEMTRGEGHARSPYDNTGIQYGLSGLMSGILTVDQFIDVNVKLGAKDIDYEQIEGRRAADPRSVELAMRTGAVNVGNNMSDVAIIDLRGPDPGAFHDVYRTYAMRERLLREQGHADNHVLWRGQIALVGDEGYTTDALLVMDEWLAAIEADERDVPLEQKVREDKPESAAPRCTDGAGTDLPAEACDATVESYSTPRFEAGMPLSDDILSCAKTPLETFDYGDVEFTDEQMATLAEIFPDGVCDYSQEGNEFTRTVPWLDYTTNAGEGGVPMGPAPVSVPFAGGEQGRVVRVAGPDRIATSLALSRDAFPEGASAVVLAQSGAFADALSASTLAAELDGPVLLTGAGSLDPRVADEIRRLGAGRVVLVGGEAVLSAAVQVDVGAFADQVVRIADVGRFGTAADIADAVADEGAVDHAVVALGQAPAGQDAWPDALASASLASARRAPVLLTRGGSLPTETAEAITRLDVASVSVIGGPAVIADSVLEEIRALGVEVQRIAGDDRYATGVAVVEQGRAAGAGTGTVVLASGGTFADALGAGPAAIAEGGVLLLVHPTTLESGAATAEWLGANAADIDRVVIAGGPAAVSDEVLEAVRAAIAT